MNDIRTADQMAVSSTEPLTDGQIVKLMVRMEKLLEECAAVLNLYPECQPLRRRAGALQKRLDELAALDPEGA